MIVWNIIVLTKLFMKIFINQLSRNDENFILSKNIRYSLENFRLINKIKRLIKLFFNLRINLKNNFNFDNFL